MRIAVASGKGGTGKTTMAVNLAAMLQSTGQSTALVDCDVEEPNAHLYLPVQWEQDRDHHVPVPRINASACLGEECSKCIELCRFKALIWMADEVMTFPELCHACGLCMTACPAKCIDEGQRLTGKVRCGFVDQGPAKGLELSSGELRVGEAMAPPLIKEVKGTARDRDIQIWDCPPGTSCPVIAGLHGADAVLLVTEPTPFGLHDLNLAVQLVRRLELPFGVVVNKAGLGDNRVEQYLEKEGIDLLGLIPHGMDAARACASGRLLIELDGYRDAFERIWSRVLPLTKERTS
ncbi:MAG TPA: (4Fe-4S)-binding protein [Desulfonatronum sp.]|nr:(4Fe-4S)-binding protein [Desulfonatronum sp.]